MTPWQVLDQLGRIVLVEVWFDLVDRGRLCLPRITQPEPAQAALRCTCPANATQRMSHCRFPLAALRSLMMSTMS